MTYSEAITQLQDTGCYNTLLTKQKAIRVSMKVSGRIVMVLESKESHVDDDAVAHLLAETEYLEIIHRTKANVEN